MEKKGSFGKVHLVLACLLTSAILAACGPSQAELNAQATKIAANILATQTAEAPTLTPTPTLTSTPTPIPTPTLTPTPTSTDTPTPTDTPRPMATRAWVSPPALAETHECIVWGKDPIEGERSLPAATCTPTPKPTDTPTPLPEAILLEPMNHQWQTYNNCGPASVAIVLAYYGHWVTQQDVNEVMPGGLANLEEYLSRYLLMARAYAVSPGSPSRTPVRQLLANRIPVIVGQRLSVEENTGHFRVVQGYDDASGEFILDDPLLSPDLRIDYDTFSRLSFRGNIVPVYPPDKDLLVKSLMKNLGMREVPL